MKFLHATLPSTAENLALDEALLEAADEGQAVHEVLRLWSAESPFIVVGRSTKVASEVRVPRAEADGVPVFRRVSGGTSIVADRGCLFYAVLLDLERRPHLRMLDAAHEFVMSTCVQAIQPLQPAIHYAGTCDLVIGGRKVSGNSLRVGRRWMLYHGTLLVDMNLSLISRWLHHPPREPAYRDGRQHDEFVTNLEIDSPQLCEALRATWKATEPFEFSSELRQRVARLAAERYALPSWNFQR